jgi:hypothetical protein
MTDRYVVKRDRALRLLAGVKSEDEEKEESKKERKAARKNEATKQAGK